MAQMTFYSAADGAVLRDQQNATFSNIRGASTATQVLKSEYTPESNITVILVSNTTSGRYAWLSRYICTFNTSGLPDDALITSASLQVRGLGKENSFSSSPSVHVAGASPSSNTNIVTSDYNKIARTSFGSISYSSYVSNNWNTFNLNSSGIANISKTGYTRMSLQLSWDLMNTSPTWASNKWFHVGLRYHSYTGTSSDPRVVVDYVLPPSLTSSTPTDLTMNSAKVYGEVTSDGESTITERGFVWAQSPNPTIANSKLVVDGTTGTFDGTISDLNSTTTYYVRAYATNAAGTSYSNDQTFITLNSPPLQPSGLSPSGGLGIGTLEPTVSWTHNPGSAGNSQSAYQVLVVRQSDSTLMYDSGKVTSTSNNVAIPSGPNLAYGVAYQWRVRTWDTEDLVSPYSSNALFKPSQKPTVSVTSPSGGVITTATPTVEWDYVDPESTPQYSYRVELLDSESALLFSTGQILGSDTSYQIPAGYIQNGESYTIRVIVRDSDQVISDPAMAHVSVEFISPAAPTVSGATSPQGFVTLDIEVNKPGNGAWYEDYLKLYRRKEDDSNWELIEPQFEIELDVFEDFEDIANWTESSEAIAATVGVPKVGMQSISIGTTGAGDAIYEKATTRDDWSNFEYMQFWVYVLDNTLFDSLEIKLGQSEDDYISLVVPASDFVNDDWVCIQERLDDLVVQGSPNRNTLDYISINILGASTEIPVGTFLVDEMRFLNRDYEYVDYNNSIDETYIYGVSAYNVEHTVESPISTTNLLTIDVNEHLVNTYLIPIENPSAFVGGWMDGNTPPSWTDITETRYYNTKGLSKPIPVLNGMQSYKEGSVELRFFDEKFDSLGLSGVDSLEFIKNYKPLLLRTWWGRNYYISIDGEISTTRAAGIGWFSQFTFTEMDP